jgi:hypothetical protein
VEYFDARQIGEGEMTEARRKEMIATACQENVEHLANGFGENYRTWRILLKDPLQAMEGQQNNHEH